MNPDTRPFVEHKLKFARTYAQWRISLDFGTQPITDARTCIEIMLKTFIVRFFAISECTKTSLQILKNRREIAQSIVGECAFVNALLIVTAKDNQLLSTKLQDKLRFINAAAIEYTHATTWHTSKEVIEVDTILQEVVEWFFNHENELNWYETYIQPELDRHANSILSQITTGVAKINDNSNSKGNKIDTGIININFDYWANLRTKHIAPNDREYIYQNIFLQSTEAFSHEFIALETEVNSVLCDHLINFPYRINSPSITDHEQSIDGIFEDLSNRRGYSLVKIFAPSGEGKTILLSQIAYKYSENDSSFQVYHVVSFNEFAIAELERIVLNTEKPLIIIIDTPSKYETTIIEGWNRIIKNICRMPVIVVIADQRYRYNEKLLRSDYISDFDSCFTEEVEVDFIMPEYERTSVLNQFIKILETKQPEISQERIIKLFNANSKFTVRERIYNVIIANDIKTKLKHKFDWEIYSGITRDSVNKKFESLFPFVALFSYFNIPVPFAIFDVNYFVGVSKFEAKKFIDRQDVIRISDGNLELRHERIASWYFSQENNLSDVKFLFCEFISVFEKHLDQSGCYLFRNIRPLLKKSFLNDTITKTRCKELLEAYVNQTKVTLANQQDLSKVMMELSTVETENYKKHYWLDQIIKINDNDFHARTKKISLFIHAGKFLQAEKILETLKEKNLYDEVIMAHEFTLNSVSLKASYLIDQLKGFQIKKHILLLIAHKKVKQGKVDEAEEIYNEVSFHPSDSSIKIALAKLARERKQDEKAIRLLNEVVYDAKIPIRLSHFIPASILLYEIYSEKTEYDLAEKILLNAIEKVPIQFSSYARLAKLYRNKAYETYKEARVAYDKAKILFEKLDTVPGLNQSVGIRTEYAKWCFEKHPYDETKHKKALAILWGTIENIYGNSIHSHTELGRIYQYSRYYYNLDLAIEILEKGVLLHSRESKFVTQVVLAYAYIQKNDSCFFDKAQKLLNSLLQRNPNHLPSLHALKKLYSRCADTENYNVVLGKIVTAENIDARAVLKQSTNYLREGKPHAALACIEAKLNDEPENSFLLHRVAIILHSITENMSAIAGNTLLEKALTYLEATEKDDIATIHLQIKIADLFAINKNTDKKQYSEKVAFRNQKITELLKHDQNNLFLFSSLSRMFCMNRRPRIAMALADVLNKGQFTFEDKLFFLREKQILHSYFNDLLEIKNLHKEILSLNKHNSELKDDELTEYPDLYNPNDSNSFLVHNWNIGLINFNKKIIKTKLGEVTLMSDYLYHKYVQDGDKVYFSTYSVNDEIYANYVEPYFEKKNIPAMIPQFLPPVLNQIKRRRT
ncbi:MAG: hypothetical protein ABIQ40_18710 [Bacteroidia bacterium]